MISNEDVATITDCANRKDRKGLVDWVRSKRDTVWILDANKEVTLSRLTDVNSGARSTEWLDFEQPYTVEAFREWLVGIMRAGIPQKHAAENDVKEYFTAVSIVASGLQVSPGSVRAWLNARNKFEKIVSKK